MNTIDPNDTAALLAYRGRGNPVATHISTAISNCFPGLEFDFRATWKNILVGVELHEANNTVINVESGSPAEAAGVAEGHSVVAIDGQAIEITMTGPRDPDGDTENLGENNLEWGNAISKIIPKAGQTVECVFRNSAGDSLPAEIEVRQVFDGVSIAEGAAEPGKLTQGLCSPWQNDYRECGCYYWAASRPDFVNVEIDDGTAEGHNWMHKNRTETTPKVYDFDRSGRPGQLTYEDLFKNWEAELRFVRRGQDSE